MLKSITRYSLLAIALTVLCNVHARDFYTENMMSVQTASMMRYGNVGASLFTGKLDFSIPIYSLEDPDFDLDIALCYNSEGFKPGKSSGYVGHDWFLQAGGCITREVRNFPDEFHRLGAKRRDGMYYFCKNTNFDKYDIFNLNQNGVTDCYLGTQYVVGNDCTKDVDYLPDIFHFNFLGYRGTFMINNKGEAQALNGDYVKVDLSGAIDTKNDTASILERPTPIGTSAITITTLDGYKYTFGGNISALEYTLALKDSHQGVKQVAPVVNAWHLSKVEAPNGRYITFNYVEATPETNLPDSLFSFSQYYDLFATMEQQNPSANYKLKYSYTKECILESIYVSGQQAVGIHFYKSKSLLRHYGHSAFGMCKENCQLDSIHVISSGRVVGRANLNYEYQSRMLNTQDGFHWRFLSDVYVMGKGTYSLSYDHTLPYPDMNIQDNISYESTMDFNGFWKTSSIQGMLSEVTYPTGGTQRFTFEHHQYNTERRYRMINSMQDVELHSVDVSSGYIGGARIQKIETYDNNSLVEKRTFEYLKPETTTSSGIYYNNLLVYFYDESLGGTLIKEPGNYSLLDTHIGYSYVTERVTDSNNTEIAKNTYTFDTGIDYYSSFVDPTINRLNVQPSDRIYDILSGVLTYNCNVYSKGNLLLNKHYKDGELVKSEQRRINGVPLLINGFMPNGTLNPLGCIDTIVICRCYGAGYPVARKLYIYPEVKTQEISYDYDQEGIALMVNRSYLHDSKLRLIREEVVGSRDTVFTTYKYPDNIMNNFLEAPSLFHLIRTGRIGTPLEQVSGLVRNEVDYVTSGKINLYRMATLEIYPSNPETRSGDATASKSEDAEPTRTSIESFTYPYLYKTMSLSLTAPIADYQPLQQVGGSLTFDSHYTLDTEYFFNSDGRPLTIKPYGAQTTTYTWNGIYPTSKTIGNQTTTYTYIPHVGISTITDPRGITTYYSYDSNWRLTEVYQLFNDVKKVINAYQYHIKTE